MNEGAFHLTPLDIRKQEFRKALRGFDTAGVEEFRTRVADELERILRERAVLEERVEALSEQLAVFRERERAMNEALVAAQQLRDETRAAATREAQLIVREAQSEARRVVDEARAAEADVRRQLAEAERQFQAYLGNFRGLLERQFAELKVLGGLGGGMIAEAVRAIEARMALAPDVAIILGTGLGGLADEMQVATRIPYEDIPGFPRATVESHAGRLLLGTLAGRKVVAMQGRFHRYEGYSLQQIAFPVRVLHALGARLLVVSNACGGMHPLWKPGELMLIADHINLLGDNPLVGPNDDSLGPRFPDMSEPYDARLRALARAVALEQGITLREGVYVAVPGPNLETRAEYRMLRTLGADVVGMSTVPEVIAAVHAGMRVLGVSIITDQCLPDALEPATVERIIAVAQAAEPNLTTLIRGVLERLN